MELPAILALALAVFGAGAVSSVPGTQYQPSLLAARGSFPSLEARAISKVDMDTTDLVKRMWRPRNPFSRKSRSKDSEPTPPGSSPSTEPHPRGRINMFQTPEGPYFVGSGAYPPSPKHIKDQPSRQDPQGRGRIHTGHNGEEFFIGEETSRPSPRPEPAGPKHIKDQPSRPHPQGRGRIHTGHNGEEVFIGEETSPRPEPAGPRQITSRPHPSGRGRIITGLNGDEYFVGH